MIGFERPEVLILLLGVLPMLYAGLKADKRFKEGLWASKILTFSLIVLALTYPFIETSSQLTEDPELEVLEDRSMSTEILEDPELEFEDVEKTSRVIASGNSSNLKDGIVRNIERNGNYLLKTDLQSDQSLEGLEDKINERNATLNLLKTDTKDDISVSINGPDSTVPGADNRYKVETYSTVDSELEPSVKVNGEPVGLEDTDEGRWSFEESFENEGVQTIEAEIDYDGYFNSNQKYYKAVDVREKPEILILGERGSLGEQLETFYNVEHTSSLPEDLSDYHSVIAKQDFDETELVDYVAEGNGLVHTGDLEEDYDILPVSPTGEDQDTDGAQIMLVIDASHTTGTEGPTGNIEESIDIAYALVDQLPGNNEVGAVAYQQEAYLISEPEPLVYNRENLKEDISRIETEGNTFHHKGLKGAEDALGDEEGNIIMISDGIIHPLGEEENTYEKASDIASRLSQQLITVGVGEDTNEEFLRELSNLGGGTYMDAEESSQLNFMFDAGGAETGTGELGVLDSTHFITENLEVSAQVLGFNPVEPKTGSDRLVASADGEPFLTTWNYGVGRVASFTGDDPDLSNLMSQEPSLVTRTLSWTVGDPERNREEWLNIESAREGETVDVRSSENFEKLTREGDNLYTGEIEPKSTGFHNFEGKTYSYNYNKQIERIGYNEENKDIISRTGGHIYEPGDEEDIVSDLETHAEREVTTEKSLTGYLLLLILVIFLSEVGYRKYRGKK